ncbi:hypothetical protein [Cytobacillus oceanisediminis]|uniref:hypothetical protein n=1 Tax=Cytobacillus oceanisediminis TaxID=665099 RepID=UPI002079579E|nr:hypothetical protein [Cytobacillus oceanisediminis]USK44665.1 hypothetical protein LIT27_01850 [Cytobacillus oceanisediminis]
MNIREWFGFYGEYEMSSDINSCVDGLLEIYAKAIMKYFSVPDAKSYHAIQKVNRSNLDPAQHLFLDWLNDKGFPYLQDLVSKKLPEDEQLIAKIEYDKYILEEEMDFQFPEDIRSSLIGIVSEMPDYIAASLEVSSTLISTEIDQLWNSWSSWLTDPIFDEYSKMITIKTHFKTIEDIYNPMSNIEESAMRAGSLFMFLGGKHYEYTRIL